MRIKCVFGHTKRVVLACCERVITFVPEIMWRVTYDEKSLDTNNLTFLVCITFLVLQGSGRKSVFVGLPVRMQKKS